jgi:hypothetical protein
MVKLPNLFVSLLSAVIFIERKAVVGTSEPSKPSISISTQPLPVIQTNSVVLP